MKTTRKIMALLLAVVMTLAFCVTVSAADPSGKITITNATVGKEYKAYKVFDATYNTVTATTAYTVKDPDIKAAAEATGSPFVVAADADANGNYAVTLASGKDIADVLTWMETNKSLFTPEDSTTATDTTVEFDVPYGYYYITSSLGTAVTVDTNTPSVSVVDKNETVKVDKKIVIDGVETTVNNIKEGDIVDYKIEITGHNYDAGKIVTNYFVYDKMDEALDLDTSSIAVTYDDSTTGNYTVLTGTDAKIGGVQYDFVINFAWTDSDGKFVHPDICNITITYKAEANEKVQSATSMDNVVTVDLNSVEVTAADDDKKPATDVKEPSTDAPTSETKSYSVDIDITKVDAENNSIVLEGATFNINGTYKDVYLTTKDVFTLDTTGTYWKLTTGDYTPDAPVTADYMEETGVAATATEGYIEDSTYTETDKVVIGSVTYRPFKTLDATNYPDAKVYTLIKKNDDKYASTSDKYKKSTEEVVELGSESKTIDEDATTDENGLAAFKKLGVGTFTITETVAPDGYNKLKDPIIVVVTAECDSGKIVWNYSIDGGTATPATDNIIPLTIENNSGTELPSTGGIGTVLFIAIGVIVFMGTAIVLVTKKRLYNEG